MKVAWFGMQYYLLLYWTYRTTSRITSAVEMVKSRRRIKG